MRSEPMTWPRWHAIVAMATLLAIASGLSAQTAKDPHIGYAYPGGGRQSTEFEVVVGGQFIKETSGIYISGGGPPPPRPRPPPPGGGSRRKSSDGIVR